MASPNPQLKADFEQNIFSITRQVHYSQSDPNLSIDVVLFINGIAIATLELKNPWTNQNVYHAQKQYREDRDPNEPLFKFARCNYLPNIQNQTNANIAIAMMSLYSRD